MIIYYKYKCTLVFEHLNRKFMFELYERFNCIYYASIIIAINVIQNINVRPGCKYKN